MKLLIFLAVLHCFYLAYAENEPFQLPDSIKDIEIPDIDDFAVIKEKCDKEGGNGTYDKFKSSANTIGTCFKDFVDVNKLKTEVEESKKTGSMDEVFGKYCAKRTKMATCVQGFIDNIRLCLNTEEKNALNITLNIIKQLGEFVCFKDGDRIAMFVAEGGVECIQSRTQGIQNCVNSTFKINTKNVNQNSLPNILIDKEKCDDLGKLQRCVVEELEKCKDSTPANIVDALFKFVKRSACSPKSKRSINFHKLFKRNVPQIDVFLDSFDLKNSIDYGFVKKCPEAKLQEISEEYKTTIKCIKEKTKELHLFVTPAEEYKYTFKKCCENLKQKLKPCLQEEHQYIIDFNEEMYSSIIDFYYKQNETLKSVSTRSEIINCFQNFKQQDAKTEFVKCLTDNIKKDDLSKKAVCQGIGKVKVCISELIQKKCIRDIAIHNLTKELLEAVTSPCRDI